MKDNIYLSIKKNDEVEIRNIEFPDLIKRDESRKAFSLLFDMFNYLGLDVDIKDICYSDNGKPYIKDYNIKFNYSHSKNYIACSVSSIEMGIDIEDDFKISDEARLMYLPGINDDIRRTFVTKEAYCKLLGDFDDEFFKKIDVNRIKNNKYEINNMDYNLVLFYDGESKKINIIL